MSLSPVSLGRRKLLRQEHDVAFPRRRLENLRDAWASVDLIVNRIPRTRGDKSSKSNLVSVTTLLDLHVRVACRQRVDPGEAEVAGTVPASRFRFLAFDDGKG